MVLDDYLKWKIKFVQYLRKLTSTYSFMIMNRLNYSPYSTSYHYSCFILSTIYFLSEFAPSLGFITKHSPEFQSQGQLESVWTVCYNEGIIEARNFQNSSCNFRKSIDFKCVVKISGNVQTFTGSSLISNNKLYEGSYWTEQFKDWCNTLQKRVKSLSEVQLNLKLAQ